MIQPKEGEINYDVAQKSPLKFYDTVMNQDVLEHKIAAKSSKAGRRPSRGVEMTSRLTKRAVASILIAVTEKLHDLIRVVSS